MLMGSFRLRCQRPEQRLLLRADHQARARRHHLQARSSSGRMGLLPGESDHWGHARAGAGQEGHGGSAQEVEEDGQEQDYGRAPERRGADGLSPGDWTGPRTGSTIEGETCQYAEQCSLVRVAGLHGRLTKMYDTLSWKSPRRVRIIVKGDHTCFVFEPSTWFLRAGVL